MSEGGEAIADLERKALEHRNRAEGLPTVGETTRRWARGASCSVTDLTTCRDNAAFNWIGTFSSSRLKADQAVSAARASSRQATTSSWLSDG